MAEPDQEIQNEAFRSSPATVYAPCVLEDAIVLLTDLYTAGDKHGVAPGEWTTLGVNLPRHVLAAVTARRRADSPIRAGLEAPELRRRLTAALTAAGIERTGTYRGRILLPRREGTPEWGWSGEAALTVGVYPGEGWTLELAQERTPVIDIVAPAEAAVADLIVRLLDGRLPDPFPPRG